MSNRWETVSRYPQRTTSPPLLPLSTPRSKSLSAIRTYSAHVNRLSDRRGGGGIIFYRVFNNSWYARVSNPRCWIIGAEGNRTGYEGTMARRLIIRMATGWIQGSPNDPWLKRIKGLRRSVRLLWGNLIKQKFRRREFLSPSNEIDFRGGWRSRISDLEEFRGWCCLSKLGNF